MILRRYDPLAVSFIAAGWAMSILGSVGGWRMEMGHHEVIESGLSLSGPLVFLAGWLLMVAAMMLPSSLDTLRWFATVDGVREAPRRLTATFLAGYAAVWTAIGLVALAWDGGIHDLTHRWPWLETRPWLIGAGALLVAGTFQLTAWSRHCRTRGRRHVRSAIEGDVTTIAALRLGAEHGAIRFRECWPVMLLSFAFGMTSLGWMVLLTGLMTAERSPRLAARMALASGMCFLAASGVVVLAPGVIV